MIAFRTLFVIDVIVALAVMYFFVDGLGDGTVSSFNIGIWLLLLGCVGIPMLGGWYLRGAGNVTGAIAVLALVAVPGCLIGSFFLLLISLPGGFR
jgi:hypothetical protein